MTVGTSDGKQYVRPSPTLIPPTLLPSSAIDRIIADYRLASLKGRKIFTFPHLDIRISRLLEKNATPADREAHIDLADWLIKYLEENEK